MQIIDTKLSQLYTFPKSKMLKCPHCGLRRIPDNVHALLDYEYRDSFDNPNTWCEKIIVECMKCNMIYHLYIVKDMGLMLALTIDTLEDAAYAVSLNVGMYQIIPFKFQTQELDLLMKIS